MKRLYRIVFPLLLAFLGACGTKGGPALERIQVVLDTDANNEVDDQHAIAYLLLSGNRFSADGITVNATRNGGDIHAQALEAERIVRLCNLSQRIPVYRGAQGSLTDIEPFLANPDFDGAAGVNFIIDQARRYPGRLVLLPVGKLTNIALALKKAPEIAEMVRIVWLGSNYPDPGEYNQENDEAAVNFILDSDVAFEIVTVRYGKPSGTDAVRITPAEIRRRMPGLGPRAAAGVEGRHGGSFTAFGDYSVNLFDHAELYGDPPSRALFDMAAVALVKNPAWAKSLQLPAPILVNGQWQHRPNHARKIVLWEHFDRDAIVTDLFATMEHPYLIR